MPAQVKPVDFAERLRISQEKGDAGDPWAYYERGCLSVLVRAGIVTTGQALANDSKERYGYLLAAKLLDVLSDIRLSECAARAVDVRAYRLYVLRQLMLCHEYQGKLDGGFSSQRDMLREAQTWLERAVFAE